MCGQSCALWSRQKHDVTVYLSTPLSVSVQPTTLSVSVLLICGLKLEVDGSNPEMDMGWLEVAFAVNCITEQPQRESIIDRWCFFFISSYEQTSVSRPLRTPSTYTDVFAQMMLYIIYTRYPFELSTCSTLRRTDTVSNRQCKKINNTLFLIHKCKSKQQGFVVYWRTFCSWGHEKEWIVEDSSPAHSPSLSLVKMPRERGMTERAGKR